MKSVRNFMVFFSGLSAWFFVGSALSAFAQYQPARASVCAVHGSASYYITGKWQSLKENANLTAGAIIKTAPDATLDLFLPDSRTVLRLMPGSILRFDRLDKIYAGELGSTITKLSLLSGTLIGSQHKLVRPSEFEVGLPNGMAKIVGTVYSLQADGTVACLKGTVSVAYNPTGNGPSLNVSVPAGFSSNPATDKATAISTTYLQNIAPDLQVVKKNDETFNEGRPITVVHDGCGDHVTPIDGYPGGDHDKGSNHDHEHGGHSW